MYRYVHKIMLGKVWHINKMLTTHLPFPPIHLFAHLPVCLSTCLPGVNLTNTFANVQRRQYYLNGAKDPVLSHQHFCFNFTGYLILQLLRWAQYFGAFLQNTVAIKSFIIDLRKGCPAWAPKLVGQIDPRVFVHPSGSLPFWLSAYLPIWMPIFVNLSPCFLVYYLQISLEPTQVKHLLDAPI